MAKQVKKARAKASRRLRAPKPVAMLDRFEFAYMADRGHTSAIAAELKLPRAPQLNISQLLLPENKF